jgi:hypothetical protein
MMASMSPGSSGSSRQFSHRLANIVVVIDRFRAEAERKGHAPFAEALSACALNMSGGNLTCPVGMLVLEETLKTGKFLASELKPQAPGAAPGSTAPAAGEVSVQKAAEWASQFSKLWTILEDEARRSGDKECLDALKDCEEITPQHQCPVRVLLSQHLAPGSKP